MNLKKKKDFAKLEVNKQESVFSLNDLDVDFLDDDLVDKINVEYKGDNNSII